NAGEMVSNTITATATGTAIGSMSAAGDLKSDTINVPNGNIGTISSGRTIQSLYLTSPATATSGAIATITAAKWQSGTINAKSLGSPNIPGSSILAGDFAGGTINLQGTPGSTASTLGTFKVARNISGNTNITIGNGGVGTFSVGQSISNTL